jgi:hypothetical protein
MTGFIDPLESSLDLPAGPDPTEHDLVRELVLRAHPEVVPELVRGETIAELIASIEPARQAYTDLVARLTPETPAPIPAVPAGGSPTVLLDPARIPASEKLRLGLQNRSRNSRT